MSTPGRDRGRRGPLHRAAAALIGSSPLDVDQHGIARFRYVRIKNRDRTTALCIDAIGALGAPAPGTHDVE